MSMKHAGGPERAAAAADPVRIAAASQRGSAPAATLTSTRRAVAAELTRCEMAGAEEGDVADGAAMPRSRGEYPEDR